MSIPYRYYNIHPWEEKSLKIDSGMSKLFIDNQDTHRANWEKLIKVIEVSQEDVEIRSLVDLGIPSIAKFLSWVSTNPRVCNHVWGMEGESLIQLLARYPSDLKRMDLAKKRWLGVGIGRPPKAGKISQVVALRAIRDNRSMKMAARSLDICPTLLWHIARGAKGIPAGAGELEALGLEGYVPNSGRFKKGVANPTIGV
jgi:hypothetical protein